MGYLKHANEDTVPEAWKLKIGKVINSFFILENVKLQL